MVIIPQLYGVQLFWADYFYGADRYEVGVWIFLTIGNVYYGFIWGSFFDFINDIAYAVIERDMTLKQHVYKIMNNLNIAVIEVLVNTSP